MHIIIQASFINVWLSVDSIEFLVINYGFRWINSIQSVPIETGKIKEMVQTVKTYQINISWYI